MRKKTKKWRSPSLGRDMELRIYGTSGIPLIGIPTRGASCGQWEEFKMVEALSHQLNNGFNQLFCLSTVDNKSLLNASAPPDQRLVYHKQYQTYLIEEVVPFIKSKNPCEYLIISGIDLGGYHAINTALKNPTSFDKAVGISGIYDIKHFMGDYYGDDVYYNNPLDFIPSLNKQPLLNDIRSIDFRLVSYQADERISYARRMSETFKMKFIEHELDIWDMDTGDEWKQWPRMIKTHII